MAERPQANDAVAILVGLEGEGANYSASLVSDRMLAGQRERGGVAEVALLDEKRCLRFFSVDA